MEEDNALRNYCRRMVSLIRSKQPRLQSSKWERKRHNNQKDSGRENTEGGRRVLAGDELRDREGEQPSLRLPPGQGPEAPAAPARLISMLKLKTFEENMRRVRGHADMTHRVNVRLEVLVGLVWLFVNLPMFILTVRPQRRGSTIPPAGNCARRNRLLWP